MIVGLPFVGGLGEVLVVSMVVVSVVIEGVVLMRGGNPIVNKKIYLLRIKWGLIQD